MQSFLIRSPASVSQLLDQVRQAFEPPAEAVRRATFPINLRQTEQGYELHALLPGISRDHINLTVQDQVLTITAEVTAPEDRDQWRFEVEPVARERKFRLSREVDTSGVSATHRDGVLIVTLPKRADVAARTIEIG